MEVTTWLKPSGNSCHEIRWQRECAGRNASERRASLEKDDAQVDPTTLSGKTDTAVGLSKYEHSRYAGAVAAACTHRESARNTGNPMVWSGTTNRTPVTARPGILGWRIGP